MRNPFTFVKKRKKEMDKAFAKEYKKLFENGNDAILIFEPDSEVILEANTQACEVYGYSKEELIGMSIRSFSSDLETGEEKIREVLRHGKIRDFETVQKNKKGEYLNILVSAFTIEYRGKISILTSNRDITARKIADKALAESEERFRTMFEDNLVVMFQVNVEDGKIIDANSAAVNFYGWSKAELITMTIFQLNISPADEVKASIEKARTNKQNRFEFVHRMKDGSFRDVEVHSSRIRIKNKEYLFSSIHDITTRKRSEERIVRLNRAIEQSPVSVFMTDAKGNIEYVNPKFTELTGYTFEEIKGTSLRLFKPDEISDEFFDKLWITLLAGEQWKEEFDNKKKDGSSFWGRVIISPIQNKEGEVISFIGIQEDITESKKLIGDLIEAKEKAEEMSRLKSSFLSNMSHELRTPLIGILGYTEMMQSIFTDPEHLHMADIVHNSGKRLHETLNLILDLSRLESNKMEIKLELVNIDELLARSFTLFSQVVDSGKISFRIDNQTPGFVFSSDERILDSILNNLINNAIKFTNEGYITIRSEFESRNQLNYIKLSVIDTGIGISTENQALIFKEFRQASEGYSRKFEGTGLGLTLTKRFVKLLDGEMFLQSSQNIGSTFSFMIPLNTIIGKKSEIPDLMQYPLPRIKEAVRKFDILVVDDDEATRNVVPLMLQSLYNVDCAEDGLGALKKTSSLKYDLILLDIGLKGKMDGIEVLHHLRKINGYLNVPVIAFTAYVFKKEREKFMAAGFTDYFAKPFTKQELLDIVSKNLNSFIS